MCRCAWTIFFLNLFVLGSTAPGVGRKMSAEVETSLNTFLNVYLDQVEENAVADDGLYETMQGDQPQEENTIHQNRSGSYNLTDTEYSKMMRNRSRENRLQELKDNILKFMGRKPEDIQNIPFNLSELPSALKFNISDDDQISEKIQSFYPSCEVPLNTDQELWKDDDLMNLFFDFDSSNINIATATLRLYRLFENVTKSNNNNKLDCDDNSSSAEDEKLLRVSIYWYTKSLKKRRTVKKRLSDSQVISDSAKWVELSVKPATKAWSRGRNLGLGVLVEDQEGNTLKADRVFKGASCTVGLSTPKPIPTIIIDAARQADELDRIHSLLGRNSTSAVHNDDHLLPIIDVCSLDFPDNYTLPTKSRSHACHLKRMYEKNRSLIEKDATETPKHQRHIRHQRQHMLNDEQVANDIRSRVVGSKVIFRHEDLQNLTNKLNGSMIHR